MPFDPIATRRFPLTIRLRRVAVCAVFVLVAGSAGRADASCGDWLAGHESTPDRQAVGGGGESVPPLRCDGPLCRGSHEGVPVAPGAPTRQFDRSEHWCRLADEGILRPLPSSPVPPEACAAAVSGFASRVDRPPRS